MMAIDRWNDLRGLNFSKQGMTIISVTIIFIYAIIYHYYGSISI